MILLDSNAWVALFNMEDSLHKQAEIEFSKIIEKKEEIIVTDYVILEVATVLKHKAGQKIAKNFIGFVLSTRGILLLNIDEITFSQIIELFNKNLPKLSFVDISILVLKKNMNLSVLTFDNELKKELKNK